MHKDPYAGPYAEAVHALWHDPLTYDPIKHGPPYLPESKMKLAHNQRSEVRAAVQKLAEDQSEDLGRLLQTLVTPYGNAPMAELAALLACLRAEVWIHLAHHWQTRGCTYYGDHLLFMRLYEEADDLVDGLAEKAVGMGSHMLVQPRLQGMHTMAALMRLYGDTPDNPGAEDYPAISLRAVMCFLAFERLVYETLESQGKLSHGIDNMLQGIADKHEEFAYLLQQRCKSKTAHNVRSAAWKA